MGMSKLSRRQRKYKNEVKKRNGIPFLFSKQFVIHYKVFVINLISELKYNITAKYVIIITEIISNCVVNELEIQCQRHHWMNCSRNRGL